MKKTIVFVIRYSPKLILNSIQMLLLAHALTLTENDLEIAIWTLAGKLMLKGHFTSCLTHVRANLQSVVLKHIHIACLIELKFQAAHFVFSVTFSMNKNQSNLFFSHGRAMGLMTIQQTWPFFEYISLYKYNTAACRPRFGALIFPRNNTNISKTRTWLD